MKLIFPHMEDIYPTGYAVVGAAALCGGATRTVSSAVIILELTNDLTYMVPVLVGVVLACGIGNLLNHSIYDCFLRNKGLPYLPFVRVKSDSLIARDVMKRELCYVTHCTTLPQIEAALEKVGDAAIPVVESDENLHLIGTISRTTLEEVLSYHERLHSYSSAKSPLGISETILEVDTYEDNYDENDNEMKVFSNSIIDSLNDPVRMTDHDNLVQMELQNPWVVIDSSPFQIVESTPVRKIVFMFMMLGGNLLYVLNEGKLVGVISKTDLVKKAGQK
eukprot:gene15762-18733_t